MSLLVEGQPREVKFGFIPKGSRVVFEETVNLETGELVEEKVVSRNEHFNIKPVGNNLVQEGG